MNAIEVKFSTFKSNCLLYNTLKKNRTSFLLYEKCERLTI